MYLLHFVLGGGYFHRLNILDIISACFKLFLACLFMQDIGLYVIETIIEMVKYRLRLCIYELMYKVINKHDSKLAEGIFTASDYFIIRETEMSSLFVSVNAHLTFRRRENNIA